MLLDSPSAGKHSNTLPREPSLTSEAAADYPGLVLLDHWNCRAVLLDSMVKRSSFLREALGVAWRA